MKINMFVVMPSPFIQEMCAGKLCLLVRRDGPLGFHDKHVMRSTFPGTCHPTIDFVIHRPVIEVSPGEYLLRALRYNLGNSVMKPIRRAIKKSGFRMFSDKINMGFHTVWYGVSVGCNILDAIRSPVPYGSIDLLHKSDIVEQKNQEAKSVSLDVSTIHKKGFLGAIAKASGKKRLARISLHPESLHGEKLKMARTILDYFQTESDKESKRLESSRPKATYAKAA